MLTLLSPLALAPPFALTTLVYHPVWLRCIDSVLAALRTMADAGDLEGMAAASIIPVEQPVIAPFFGTASDACLGLAFPGIMVWPFQQESHDPAAGPNDRDEIGYPVAISFVDKGAGVTGSANPVASRSLMRRHMLWREKVSRRFRHATWPTITEVQDSNLRPLLYAIPEQYRSGDLFHGAMVVDFLSQEGRDS